MMLRPSSAHIWTACAAQPRMAAMMPPEEPSDPAREGTCAAWLAEMVLTGQAANTAALIGATHENGWVVTADMASHIADYVSVVRGHGGVVHTERKVRLNAQIEGTPDAFAVLDGDGVLRADDLKYGFGIVEPRRNHQVSIYAGAILRGLSARGVTIRKVVIGIYQPRAYHPAGIYRTWVTNPEELMAYVHWIEARGAQAANPQALATAGEHCEYCPAAATCPAVTHEIYRVYDRVTADQQRHMTAKEMAEELAFLTAFDKMLAGRKKAVEAEAEARIKRAEHIPGWHLEERRGNRRFKVPASVVKAMTGIEPTVPKMVTPAELIRMGASATTVAALSETPRIAPGLKPVGADYYVNLFRKGTTG